MRFSIVTPSYNQADFIADTIESVINQTYLDYEYIIVDGRSTDGTDKILESYSRTVSKIIIESDNGQTDAINKGFRYASGEIYAYLNSDDCYFSDTLEKVNDIFLNNPEVDVVYGDCVFTDQDGQFIRYFSEIWDYYPKKLLNNSNFIMQPSTFWRRSVFEKYGPFDRQLHFGFDWAFWCELAKNNCKFYRAHEVLSANRVYKETKTSSGGDERLKELRKINRKYKTTILDNAYYTFSFSELLRKRNKSFIDYMCQLFYFIMSYQNIIFHITHADQKIINGVYPHSGYLKQSVILKVPLQKDYSVITIKLHTPGYAGQEVTVKANEVLSQKYRFDGDRLNINIDAKKASIVGDLNISMYFDRVYKRKLSLPEKLRSFYQSKDISAELLSFTVT
jgi:glycosyltransferase involved in cell wall biosynthesis